MTDDRRWSLNLWARLVAAHGDGPEARRVYTSFMPLTESVVSSESHQSNVTYVPLQLD